MFMQCLKEFFVPAVVATDWSSVLYSNSILPEIIGLDEISLLDGRIDNYLYPRGIWKTIKKNGIGEAYFFDIDGKRKRFYISCINDKSVSIVTFTQIYDSDKSESDQSKSIYQSSETSICKARFFDSGPIPTYITDAEGKFVVVNKGLVNLLGFESSDEVKGTNIIDFIVNEESRNSLIDKLEKQNKKSINLEYQIKTKDGKIVWVRDTRSFDIKSDRDQKYCYGILQDVTSDHEVKSLLWAEQSKLEKLIDIKEHRLSKAEKEHRLSTIRLSALLDSIPDAAWIKDKNLKLYSCNKSYLELSGKTKEEEIIGKDDFYIWGHKLGQEYRINDIKAVKMKHKAVTEERVFDADGNQLWYEVIKLPILDDNGDVIGLGGIGRDITDRKKLQIELEDLVNERTREIEYQNEKLTQQFYQQKELSKALSESRDRFKSFLDYSMDVMVIVKDNGDIKDVFIGKNSHFIIDQSTFVKMNIKDIVSGSSGETIGSIIENTIKTGDPASLQFSFSEDAQTVYYDAQCVKRDNRTVQLFIREVTELKLAREIAEHSEEKFKRIFNLAPDPIAIASLNDNNLIDINNAFEKMFQVKASEVTGRHFMDLIRRIGLDEAKPKQDTRQNPQKITHEIKANTQKGVKYFLVSEQLISIGNNDSTLMILKDITELKKNQLEISKNYNFLDAIIRSKDEVLFVKDINGYYTFYFWPDFEDSNLFDVDNEFIGKRIEDIGGVSEKRISLANEMHKRVIETGESVTYTTRVNYPIIHSVETMRVTLSPMKDDDGNVISVVGTARNIGEEEQTLEKLRESELRYRILAEGISSPVFVHNGERIVYHNKAFEESLGCTKDELNENSLYSYVHPDDEKKIKEMYNQRHSGDTVPGRMIIKMLTKQKNIKYWDVTISKIILQSQSCSLVTALDITESINREKELAELSNYYNKLLDTIPDAFFIISEQGEYLDYRIPESYPTVLDESELKGKRISDLFPADIAQNIMEKVSNTISKKQTELIEYSLSNNSEICYYQMKIVFRDKNSVFAISRDITNLKLREKQLEESNKHYSSLLDAIPDIIFIQQYDGKFVDFKAEKMSDLYVPPNEIIGKNIKDVMSPDITAIFLEKASIVQNTKRIQSFEYSIVINGKKRYFQCRLSYRDEKTLTSVIRDITKLKIAQIEISDRKEFLESLIMTMYEAVWVKDIFGRYTYYRWPAYENAGGDLSKYMGKLLDEVEPEDDHLRLTNEMFRRVIESRESASYRTEVYTETVDKTIIVDVTLTPMLDKNNEITGVIGVAKDVTKQFKAEDKARYFERRYADIVEAIEDIIFEIRKRRIVFVSPSIKQIVGVDPKDLIGLSLKELIESLSIKTPFNWIQKQKLFEMEIVNPKGESRFFEVRYRGQGNMITGIAREITRRKNLEILKKNYRSGLIHELKNPLVLIRGYAEMLKGELNPQDESMIDIILQAVAREDDRITSLTCGSISGWSYNFTSINAYHLFVTRFEYLQGLFDSFVNNYHVQTDGVFRKNVARELKNVRVMIDINSLTEVMENLISNAVKYSPSDHIEVEMNVTLDESSEWVNVILRDQGYGIDNDFLNSIFKPFFRVTGNENTKQIDGMGMGLANVKLHVEANGGAIDVDSTEGQGSTFTIRLPVYQIKNKEISND
jgi:PAS domain S-box-containing protein